MKLRVLADAESVAREGAAYIADAAQAAVKDRGTFIFAVSGGRTPWVMMRALAREPLPWDAVHIVQVDERVAPADDPDRNLAHLRESLLSNAPLPPDNIHAMPVEEPDLAAASAAYGRTLEALAGTPPVLDLVHLGLGPDGHTASLVPGDPVLSVSDMPVGTTGVYQGRHRMTLTYPVLDGARGVLFIVTGEEKVDALKRLVAHDPAIPAGRVRPDNALVFADRSAAAGVDHG
ncbi:MAG: 6-phosphogluconolactonase [Alphaproteobacteria bacterium]|nr:6-phosphogluconolactonase [Alphaproteobacteria bacterium]